ncbi:HEPN domain-containing protein [Glutamicibacter sp. MCAF14]|uniref:HEPN domain-containing protein n=1 Tax=Glutamicibacter sp. MCAF14 TaxID=3233043 RepID=UPI003F8FCE49
MSNKHDTHAVQSLYEDYQALCTDLRSNPSGLAALNRSYHKHLLLAAASSLEAKVKVIVAQIFEQHGSTSLSTFVEKRVMSRSYHTLFDWPGGKAKGFFTSFGDICSNKFNADLGSDSTFKNQHDAFMQLGQKRNLLVHNDYANALVELTPEEIMQKFSQASDFVSRMAFYITYQDDDFEI